MSDIVSPLLQWLNANPELAGLVTFVISAAESVAIIGTIIPGSVTMTAIGTLAGAGVIPLYPTIIWAILGAIVGDGISYWFGRHFKDGLHRIWPFRNNPNMLLKGETFVNKYGWMSVFIGRFIGPVRALVPLVAGMFGMRPLHFFIANVLSAIGWAPIYMLPGILLGTASLELPPDIAMHVLLVLFLIFLFIVLCLWVVYKLLQLVSTQVEQILTNIWHSLRKSRYFHIATTLLKHHNPHQHHGQLILAFYLILTSGALSFLIYYVHFVGAEHIFVNQAVFHFFRSIRSDSADSVMIAITLLGQKQVILPVVGILFAWLLYTRRLRAAIHTLALGVMAAGSVYFIKHLVQSQRPWGIMQSPETYSMPSGHTTLATTVYLGIAFMVASTMIKKRRWLIYTPALICSLIIGISRLYLGAHWFTDTLAGWLLGGATLMLVILSYHRQHEKPIDLMRIALVFFTALSLSYTLYWEHKAEKLKTNYEQAPWPSANIPMQRWWQKGEPIPNPMVSLFGFPSHPINIEWVGDISHIRQTLLQEGWSEPPERDWISILHRISDIQSGEYLPLVSPQYLDKRPVLILIRHTEQSKKLIVLRLWASNRTIKSTAQPLYVGNVDTVQRSYSWLFRKKHEELVAKPSSVFVKSKQHKKWECKAIKRADEKTTILLIKENH